MITQIHPPKNQFKIAHSDKIAMLEIKVNELINDGWELVGHTEFGIIGRTPCFFQTLKKEISIFESLGIQDEE